MIYLISFALNTLINSYASQPANDFELDSYKWKNRLILLFTKEATNERLDAQTDDLLKDNAGLLDREIRVFKISKSQKIVDVLSNETMSVNDNLRKELNVPDNGFYVVLIGKDGTVKYKDSNPISREKLYAIIDAMPMRQAEMRRKNRER